MSGEDKGAVWWTYHQNCAGDEDGRELHAFVVENAVAENWAPPGQPRFAFLSDPPGTPYRYFKSLVHGLAFPACVRRLLQLPVVRNLGVPFDAAFVNLYRDGHDSVPPHRDATHGVEAPIVSLSFYERDDPDQWRELHISSDMDGTVHRLAMQHGSAVVMLPGMQERFKHSVPPSDALTWRVNVTLRLLPPV
jgi:hypothetical protein